MDTSKERLQKTIVDHYKDMDEVMEIAHVYAQASSATQEDMGLFILADEQDALELWQECDRFFEESFDYFRSFKGEDAGAHTYEMILNSFAQIRVVFLSPKAFENMINGAPNITFTPLHTAPWFSHSFDKKEFKTNITRDIVTLQDRIWKDFKAILDNIGKGSALRAMRDMETARDALVRLSCKKLKQNPCHWLGTDAFSAQERDEYLRTYPSSSSEKDLMIAFDNLFKLFIKMLKENGAPLHAEEYEDFFKQYK